MSIGVKYISHYEKSGYGVAAISYLKAIIDSDLHFTWTPMVRGKKIGMSYEPFEGKAVGEPSLDSICNRTIQYDTVVLHTLPEFYSYWREQEADKYLVGYTVWETTKPPEHWRDLINQLDHLLVPTDWNRQIFRDFGITIPIDVIPHISEFQGEAAPSASLISVEENVFLFYIISTWTERKVIWKVIDAYVKAFNKNENVELLIKTSEGDTRNPRNIFFRFLGYPYYPVRKSFNKHLEKFKDIPAITLVADDSKTDEYIRSLHTRGDCYVSLCRGEGWGIGSFEAAHYGKPVIMTGFGGQTSYLHPEYSWLVDYDLVSVIDKNAPKSYSPDQKWAEANVEQAAEFMRYVYEHQEEARKKGEMLKRYVIQEFGNKKIADQFILFLKSINP